MKPQNCILSERDRCIKLIDFGAAADLRIGGGPRCARCLLLSSCVVQPGSWQPSGQQPGNLSPA